MTVWVCGSSAVAGGAVDIGSTDGRVYALKAATGHFLWTHATGGPVHSSPAVTGGTVNIGSTGGNAYALRDGLQLRGDEVKAPAALILGGGWIVSLP